MKRTIFSWLLFLFIFYAMIHPSFSISNRRLKRLCRETFSPTYCFKVLKADPRTASSDIRGLNHITLELAHSKAMAILKHIRYFARRTHNHKLKARLSICSKYYVGTEVELNLARRSLKVRNYRGVSGRAASAMEHSESCEDQFETGPPDVPGLKEMNNEMQILCSMLFLLAGSTR